MTKEEWAILGALFATGVGGGLTINYFRHDFTLTINAWQEALIGSVIGLIVFGLYKRYRFVKNCQTEIYDLNADLDEDIDQLNDIIGTQHPDTITPGYVSDSPK
jgi:hypothetical protein